MKRFLRPEGISIHAVDHVHRGRGAEEHLANLRLMISGLGTRPRGLGPYTRGDVDRYRYVLPFGREPQPLARRGAIR